MVPSCYIPSGAIEIVSFPQIRLDQYSTSSTERIHMFIYICLCLSVQRKVLGKQLYPDPTPHCSQIPPQASCNISDHLSVSMAQSVQQCRISPKIYSMMKYIIYTDMFVLIYASIHRAVLHRFRSAVPSASMWWLNKFLEFSPRIFFCLLHLALLLVPYTVAGPLFFHTVLSSQLAHTSTPLQVPTDTASPQWHSVHPHNSHSRAVGTNMY